MVFMLFYIVPNNGRKIFIDLKVTAAVLCVMFQIIFAHLTEVYSVATNFFVRWQRLGNLIS